jgi:hypothetical protein
MARLLRLYPFKYRDPISRTWIKGRYKASLDDIAARYAEWTIAGEPEVRGNIPSSSFNPYRWNDGAVTYPCGPDVELLPFTHGAKLEFDSLEMLLVGVFLRRYVTYCARQRRFAAMQGAADLLRRVKIE